MTAAQCEESEQQYMVSTVTLPDHLHCHSLCHPHHHLAPPPATTLSAPLTFPRTTTCTSVPTH